MEYSSPVLQAPLPAGPLIFSPHSLYARLQLLVDQRCPRGVRYPLAVLLTIAVLAKLADQNLTRAIADWARWRAPALCALFGLTRPTMPHDTTWIRLLDRAVDPAQFARVVGAFFAEACLPQQRVRGQFAVAIDGKTLRGTIPAGQTQGVHLLAAYVPGEGVVLAQVAVDGKENEIVAAPRLLSLLDLRGVVVTGDALLGQRALSRQIRQAGGDYLWIIKANQPELHADLTVLFETPLTPSHPGDFATAQSFDATHGRLEQRTLTRSDLLVGYSTWPHLAQVFRVERRSILADGRVREDVAYGVTSLPPTVADAERLLGLVRGHWGIENGLHYRRDVTLLEDRSQLRQGQAPQNLATLNNLVLGLVAGQGQTNVAAARRAYAAAPDQALALLTAG